MELIVFDRNTWNHLTVQKNKNKTWACLKNVKNKMCLRIQI